MKLKKGFITHTTDKEHILVAADGSFNGIVKSNKTAAFIINCLKEDTSEDDIVNLMLKTYDAPKEVIFNDVHKIINSLKSIGALEE